MKIALALLLVACLALAQSAPTFEEFVETHGKVYANRFEAKYRRDVYAANLDLIDAMNANASGSLTFGVTQFADLTPEEFKSTYLSGVPPVRDPTVPVAPDMDDDVLGALPESFDWRPKGAVTPVKNQGQCGSCWAFSATGNMEGQWFLAGNDLVGLSEQNLVDCDHQCMTYQGQKSCDAGCQGGLQPNAFSYVISNGGIDSESSYPYQGVDGTCSYKTEGKVASISNYTMVSTNETQIAAYLVAHGPLAIAVDASEWQFYLSGVFNYPCGTSLDHGVLFVGYGTEKDIFGYQLDFWIVKNSWGGSWGESGYIRISRGNGECGCNTFVSSAII